MNRKYIISAVVKNGPQRMSHSLVVAVVLGVLTVLTCVLVYVLGGLAVAVVLDGLYLLAVAGARTVGGGVPVLAGDCVASCDSFTALLPGTGLLVCPGGA